VPSQAALAGQPIRCRFCGRPRLTLDYHYAVCPRLEACLPIRRTRARPKPPAVLSDSRRMGRAYSLARRCPECGQWITAPARACKRHMTLGKGRGRALTVKVARKTNPGA